MTGKVQVTNAKGLKLSAIVECEDINKPNPGVIILHGFTGYKEEKHLESLSTFLVNQGFAAIRFDASGFGESEGITADEYRVSNYLSDIGIVHEYFKSLDFVDQEKIFIAGHSLGGGLSVIYSAGRKDLIACCAIQPCPQINRDSNRYWLDEWKHAGVSTFELSEPLASRVPGGKVDLPWAFAEDDKNYNAVEYANSLRTPLAVIYGDLDTAVHPTDSIKIFDNASVKDKKLIEMKGIGHDYGNYPEMTDRVNQKVINFLKLYL